MLASIVNAMPPWLQALPLVDAVIGLTVLEALVLIAVGRRLRPGVALPQWLPSLLAGVALMLALRSQLAGDGVPALACWLAAAGVAHAFDQWQRWRQPRAVPAVPEVSKQAPQPPLSLSSPRTGT